MLFFSRLCPALVKSPCKKQDGCAQRIMMPHLAELCDPPWETGIEETNKKVEWNNNDVLIVCLLLFSFKKKKGKVWKEEERGGKKCSKFFLIDHSSKVARGLIALWHEPRRQWIFSLSSIFFSLYEMCVCVCVSNERGIARRKKTRGTETSFLLRRSDEIRGWVGKGWRMIKSSRRRIAFFYFLFGCFSFSILPFPPSFILLFSTEASYIAF